MAPNLSTSGNKAYLTWLEPASSEKADAAKRLALRFSVFDAGTWSPARTIVESDRFFANWADFPGIAMSRDGALFAHWPEKSAPATYAYDVQLARSIDGGKTWERLGPLNRDGIDAEHGFVSLLPADDGLHAFWLDGREVGKADGVDGEHGTAAMTLRAALLPAGADPLSRLMEDRLLDERVCDCCQTSAAMTSIGPVLVYRDRDGKEVRDTWIVRKTEQGWGEPRPVSVDGWEVPGCPVNGPAVAAEGDRVAVAWFTASGNRPRVLAALSNDSGATFDEPIEVDASNPPGRVGIVLDDRSGAIVSWLAAADAESFPAIEGAREPAAIKLRRISTRGGAGDSMTIEVTRRARSSGFPRMARIGGLLLVAWTEPGEASRIRAVAILVAAVPQV